MMGLQGALNDLTRKAIRKAWGIGRMTNERLADGAVTPRPDGHGGYEYTMWHPSFTFQVNAKEREMGLFWKVVVETDPKTNEATKIVEPPTLIVCDGQPRNLEVAYFREHPLASPKRTEVRLSPF